MKVRVEKPANGRRPEIADEALLRLASQPGLVQRDAHVAVRFGGPGTGRIVGATEIKDRFDSRMPTCALRCSPRNVLSVWQGYTL